jgi:3-methyladenine DNA glycosylase AlkC
VWAEKFYEVPTEISAMLVLVKQDKERFVREKSAELLALCNTTAPS